MIALSSDANILVYTELDQKSIGIGTHPMGIRATR
jgi:hypothetical protein